MLFVKLKTVIRRSTFPFQLLISSASESQPRRWRRASETTQCMNEISSQALNSHNSLVSWLLDSTRDLGRFCSCNKLRRKKKIRSNRDLWLYRCKNFLVRRRFRLGSGVWRNGMRYKMARRQKLRRPWIENAHMCYSYRCRKQFSIRR